MRTSSAGDPVGEMVRRAGESALMLAAAIQTPGFLSSEAIADVVMRSYTDLIDAFAAMPGADAAGQIIADFATAHALALVRLAQLEQVSLPKAAARLVLLVKEG